MLRVGLLINPVAGLGGPTALRGSDGAAVQRQARVRGGEARGLQRARRLLTALAEAQVLTELQFLTWGGAMGAAVFDDFPGVPVELLGEPAEPSSAADTRAAALTLRDAGAELLVLCGGDGTARDVYDAIGASLPVLGVPCGVKMHSGVFAATPESAADLLLRLVHGGLVSAVLRDVRDLDEARLRAGEINTRFYGELAVLEPGGYLQHTKSGGRENEALALEEIVAEVVELMGRDGVYVLAPGSTLAAVKAALGLDGTLLGVDVWQVSDGAGRQIGRDVDAAWLEARLPDEITLVLSFTREQGFLLGRGNQQLSPTVLRRVPAGRLWILGTRSKLATLDGRPLLVDTDDPALDRALAGLHEIITGYQDRLWYRVGTAAGEGPESAPGAPGR